jgi:hypothetical protein
VPGDGAAGIAFGGQLVEGQGVLVALQELQDLGMGGQFLVRGIGAVGQGLGEGKGVFGAALFEQGHGAVDLAHGEAPADVSRSL